jgi:hypothetical protein
MILSSLTKDLPLPSVAAVHFGLKMKSVALSPKISDYAFVSDGTEVRPAPSE